MPELGWTLASEEKEPLELVRIAARAEEKGFTHVVASDHFHPWSDAQGNSPNVWPVLGAVANATERVLIGTGVTCPTIRVHPAIVAQAAATVACMAPGRFFLGVGTGEALNEHIVGRRWPAAHERREMLEEAIGVMRLLWKGGLQSHEGKHYKVENARLYTLPDEPVPVWVAAAGEEAAKLAGEIGDGYVGVAPKAENIETFRSAGGGDKPRLGQIHIRYGEDRERCAREVRETWPNIAVPGELSQELPLPRHYEQAGSLLRDEDVDESVSCGPDADLHLERLAKYADAGYTHVFVHQIGDRQDEAMDFYASEIMPRFASAAAAA